MSKVREKIAKNLKNLLPEDAQYLIVGVSGGADSICLLHNLYELKKEHVFNCNIAVCHLNHGIRKDGSAESDAEFVKNFCDRYSLAYFYKFISIPERAFEDNETEEEAGRNARYRFFNDVGKKLCKNYYIVTGANANDNVETVLMRLCRGTSVTGLSGIPIKNGNIIRPMLDVERKEIEEYLEEESLDYITDPTNLETDFTRNKIRLELIPYINENLNPNFLATMTRAINTYKEDAEHIEKEASQVYADSVIVFTDKVVKLNKNILTKYDNSIIKRVVFRAIKDVIGSDTIRFKACILDSIAENINKSSKTFVVSKDCVVEVNYASVDVFGSVANDSESSKAVHCELDLLRNINTEVSVTSDDESFTVKVSDELVTEEIQNTSEDFYIPYDIFKDKTVTFRHRLPGDVFSFSEGKTKKVNKVLSEKHIDLRSRDKKTVLVCDGIVYAIFGVQSARFQERTGRMFHFKVERT